MFAKPEKPANIQIADRDVTVGLPNSTFKTIQEALDAVSDGHTIWVGPGVYSVGSINLEEKTVRIVSLDGPETTHIVGSDSTLPVFLFQNEETEECQIEGFTIMNGNARYGGGMFIRNASPVIKNVIFRDNKARYGGAVFICHNASPAFLNVLIENNSAERGGGMYSYDAFPVFDRVTFARNKADYGGGLELRYPCVGANNPIRNLWFLENQATKLGGGVFANENRTDFRKAFFQNNRDTDLVFCDFGYVEEYPIYE